MKRYLTIVFIAGILSACNPDKFLEVIPTGSKIPTTVEDFDRLLQNPDAGTSASMANLQLLDPDIAMPGEHYNELTTPSSKLLYTWDSNPYASAGEVDNDWNWNYRKILTWNMILAEVDQAKTGNATEILRTRVKGQALGQRALDFFLLVNEYGPHYAPSSLDKPAVPIPFTIDLKAQLPRSTVKEVYQRIETDLDESIQLLQSSEAIYPAANFRPGLASVYGLKALIALYKADFANAASYSDKALALYNFLYDYRQIKLAYPDNAWRGVDNPDFKYSTQNKEILWNRTAVINYNPVYYSDALLNIFDKVNDQRYVLFSSQKSPSGNDLSPYTGRVTSENSMQAGITVPELYLVNAEAKVRLHDAAGALNSLNKLLEKRLFKFIPYSASSAGTEADILNLIKRERRKELTGSGRNWLDLKRYQAYGDQVPTFQRTVNNETLSLEPGSNNYVVPVSANVKSLNKNI